MNGETKQSDAALVPRQSSNGALSLLIGSRAETAKALTQAILACHAVEKASNNEFHHYKYASADTIIEEGRKALASAGLALVPVEASLNGSEREGPDRFELVRTFALLHTSGEITPLRVCWPVCPEKGRPLDKATAIADTLSLSYLLRDILLMARLDDMNMRDDRPAAKPKKEPARSGAEMAAQLFNLEAALVHNGRCQSGELLEHIRHQGTLLSYPAALEQWQAQEIAKARDWCRTFLSLHPHPQKPAAAQAGVPPAQAPPPPAAAPARLVTPEQAKTLQDLMCQKGRSWARKEKGDAGASICSIYGLPETSMIEDLAPLKYEEIRRALLEERDFVRS